MKKQISLLLSLILYALSAVVPVSAVADNHGAFQQKTVTAHLYKMDDTAKIDCLFFDDLPDVPYISAEDYLNRIHTIDFSTEDNHNGTYTVKSENGSMEVDTRKDTVHFDDFEAFTYYDSVDANESESAEYVNWDYESEPVGEQKGVDIELSGYHIDLVGENGKVYFPLYTISDMFSDLYLSAIYRGGEIYFIRSQDDEPYYDDAEIYENLTREKEMIDFTYNELCFSIDHFYGVPPKAEIAKDVEEKGFDKAIKEYDKTTATAREYLLSEDRVDFCKGLMMLDNYFNDGGHTLLCGGMVSAMNGSRNDSSFATQLKQALYHPENDEMAIIAKPIVDMSDESSSKSALKSLKNTAFEDFDSVKSWEDAHYYQNDKTGVFVFEEFKDAVVEPFKWSLEKAVKDGMENFVIDLSTNGGGSQAVVFYMLGVICGDSTLYETNTFTGNQSKECPEIDKNLDGKFDDKDKEIKYDLNYAILTSRHSFSSANMLPCIAQSHGVAIVGETSGGGTCALSMRYMPDGSFYYMSSDMKITYEDGEDLDGGAEPDTKLDTSNDYENFYDFKKIEEGVEEFYSGNHNVEQHTTAPTEKETEESTEKPTEKSTEPILPTIPKSASSLSGRNRQTDTIMLWVILGTMAVILIVIIVLIVYLVKGGKKKKTPPNQPPNPPTPPYPPYSPY